LVLGMRTLALIPAYNEASRIAPVIEALRTLRMDVVVVDDGSSDDTAGVARTHGAKVLVHAANAGTGAAEQTGFLFALEHGYDAVVRLDGDGQHDPSAVASLLGELAAGRADLVVGSRFLIGTTYRSTWPRRIGIRVLGIVITLLIGSLITDPTSGFRALNRRAMQVLARRQPEDYPEPESLIAAYRAGCRVLEVPVRMYPRETGRSSIGLLGSIYYMLKVTLAIGIDLLRPRAGLEV
jgi:glycosyltransferase involved in cell wall biosynthesis